MIFSPEEQQLIRSVGTASSLQPGHFLYMEGDRADMLYYLQAGRVRVFQNFPSGREVTLDVVEAGHIVGESAFLPEAFRPTCIQAVNAVRLISFRSADIVPYFQTMPQLALHFLQQCSNTIDRLSLRMQEQCLLDRYGKVASLILDITASDSPDKDTLRGKLPYTHEQIAASLGLSRPTVTAVLREFARRGWVENGYGYVRLLDRPALLRFIEAQKNQA